MPNGPTTRAEHSPLIADSAPAPLALQPVAIPGVPSDDARLKPNPSTHHSRLPWIALAVLILIGIAGYLFWRTNATAAPATASATTTGRGGSGGGAIPVSAATARQGDIAVYYTGLGAVTPIFTVTVKSRVDGQLMDVKYKEGDLVHKGDLLLELDARPYQVQLTLAKGQLAKDQAAIANARIDLSRDETLFSKQMIPEQQLATQRALVAQNEAALEIDQGQIDSANLNIAYCHITAPITGRVGLRLVDPGNIVHASDASGLLVITQMQPISVVFTIAEDQLQVVLKKMHAGPRLTVDAYDRDMKTRLAHGSLASLDNEIDPTTGTLKLRATFDNEAGTLFPNQFINVRLLVEEKRGVTLVPTAAVQRNAQATYVFVVKPDHTATSRPVTLGTTEGDDSEITSGLVAGDVVVMTGVDKLQEGSKVDAQIAPAKVPAKATTATAPKAS
jgi:multidrug efflux system membrane fusion protein